MKIKVSVSKKSPETAKGGKKKEYHDWAGHSISRKEWKTNDKKVEKFFNKSAHRQTP